MEQMDIPSLVQVDKKHNIISEHCHPMQCWHGDDKRKHIINECTECLQAIMDNKNFYNKLAVVKQVLLTS